MGPKPDPRMRKIDEQISPSERQVLSYLDSPSAIQSFLNSVPYSEDKFYRCPLRVLRDRKGHCFDGALFAAMALRRLGHPARILELVPNDRDDDHIIALFKLHPTPGSNRRNHINSHWSSSWPG